MTRMDVEMRGISNVYHGVVEYFMHPPEEKKTMIKEMRLVERISDDDVILYWRFKLPLMSDRDNICMIKRQILPDGTDYGMCTTIERDDIPPVDGVVRMLQSMHVWIRPSPTDPEVTLYTEFDNLDMKGYFPARLMNMALASQC